MKNMKKTMALLLAVVLLVGVAVGATIAWLTAETPEVKNTFTTSSIGVALNESTTQYKMIPGWTIAKDPKVNVTADSEDCYLFVKVTESENFKSFMTYAIADGWTKLSDGVYYRIFDSNDSENANVKGTAYSVLKGDKVTVLDNVTKENMAALTDATKPTLTFQAYACQLYKSNTTKFEPAEAWAKVVP